MGRAGDLVLVFQRGKKGVNVGRSHVYGMAQSVKAYVPFRPANKRTLGAKTEVVVRCIGATACVALVVSLVSSRACLVCRLFNTV